MIAGQRQPWLRFYTADWRGDAGLRAVGFAARGLWMDMLSLMHEAEPYGHLAINGEPIDAARLAARVGGTAREVQTLLDRLERECVFSRADNGAIYSRRMVRDAQRAERDRLNGGKGGNPSLKENPDVNEDGGPPDNGGVNPQDKAHARASGARPLPEARRRRKSSEANASDANASETVQSAADVLWSVGLPILASLVGKPPDACRGLLGQLRKHMNDDCPKLLLALQEAAIMRPSDPVAWLTAVSGGKKSAEPPSERRIREQREHLHKLVYGEETAPTIDLTPDRRLLQ